MTDTIFTVQTPGNPNENDGVDIVMGTVFTPAVNGTVTGIRWYFPVTPIVGTVIGALYTWTSDASGALLEQANFVAPVAATWNVVAINQAVTAGNYYIAVVYSPNRYVVSGGFFNGTTITNGALTAPADDNIIPRHNGKFAQNVGGLTFPGSFFNGNNFFADVTFEPESTDVAPTGITLTTSLGAPAVADSSMESDPDSVTLPLTFGAPTVSGATTPPALVNINLAVPGFAQIVTGVGACIVDALDQTPAGAPCRQCLLLPTQQVPWDNCGPCDDISCSGQVALAIRSVYGSDTFPQPATGKTWAKCTPRWWVARVVASVTRCVPTIDELGAPPSCAAELAAAIILENDRAAVRQAIACCLSQIYAELPPRIGAWFIDASNTVGELGGCAGSETEFVIGVQACPCPG